MSYPLKAWLKRHKRLHMHFIPTSSSWLNVIERFFRDLDDKRLRRGAFRNVPALIDAIMSYIEEHNDNPKPIVLDKDRGRDHRESRARTSRP